MQMLTEEIRSPLSGNQDRKIKPEPNLTNLNPFSPLPFSRSPRRVVVRPLRALTNRAIAGLTPTSIFLMR